MSACIFSSESIEIVEKLQQLLITKGSNESGVMELLEDPTLVKNLMTLTHKQVCITHTKCAIKKYCTLILVKTFQGSSDQREGVLDISHNAHLSVQYKKYCTLILVKTFQDIITYL